MSRLNPPTLREWQPGDGLTCSYAKRAPVEMPCGRPVMVAVSVQSAGPRAGDRTVARVLCEHHAHGRMEGGMTPNALKTKALSHNLMEQKELQLEEERLTQRLATIEFNFETVNPGVGWGQS